MLLKHIANVLFKLFLFFTVKVDTRELSKIPMTGPGIFITNHTTNIEGPMYYVKLFPRPMTALGKAELWKNPFTRFFMDAWEVIPLSRGSGDMDAIRKGLQALEAGKFLGIAP
ncbi:MAG: 1-acyl-sn-glycerol-3-phosphate acyltransferase, partial [Spirochaetales bacterium]|nr:1-acyl-sn-glycerol-3-phosphate acyltransferase [Spirochaetales bacterium]